MKRFLTAVLVLVVTLAVSGTASAQCGCGQRSARGHVRAFFHPRLAVGHVVAQQMGYAAPVQYGQPSVQQASWTPYVQSPVPFYGNAQPAGFNPVGSLTLPVRRTLGGCANGQCGR